MKVFFLFRRIEGAFFFMVFFLIPVDSFAGFRSDHFIGWGSLGGGVESQEVSEKIIKFANSDRIDSDCDIRWKNNDSMLYLNGRRLKIPDDLLRKVFTERDSESFSALSHALRSFRVPEANVRDGLDGIVFYDGERTFRMMSFTVGARRIKTYPRALKASASREEVERAFCSLLPPITRAP
ncbi:hypothetical protein [Variovorax sp. YR750]|uniref:hypothetical protein n=1 Tax=Variovorax sp. YR750 TaxID=1884384 RepID=UPI00116027D8|nr:hypothetical protein [Variovorax sp. YR750]